MQGIVFRGQRELELVSFPDPQPGSSDVVLRVEASGMCGSDLHFYRGPTEEARGNIAGHEPAGVIVDVGSEVPHHWLGRAVMVHHYFGCGMCDQCRSGWTQMCREGALAMGNTAHGSHAEFVTVPLSTILPAPDGLSRLAAAAISCGAGTAWGALKRLKLTADDTFAIFGQGPVGLSATQFAVAMGARVIALDISPTRLARAREFGAWQLINPAEVDSVADTVRELMHGRGVTKSLETSGASSAAQTALQVLDPWGAACWVGIGSTVQFDISEHIFRQITAMTSWTLSIAAMADCARFVVERDIDLDALFTDRWTLADCVEAYEQFDQQTTGKGVFIP